MELQEIFRALKKGWVSLVLITFLTLAAAGVWNFFIVKPVYQTSAMVMVEPEADFLLYSEPRYSDRIAAEEKLAQLFPEIANQPASKKKVIQKAGLDIPPEKLPGIVELKRLDSSPLFKVTAKGKDPQAARILADTAVAVFSEELSSLMPKNRLTLIYPAADPPEPESRNRGKSMMAAGAAALILAVSRIFFKVSLDGTAKSGSDLTQYLKIPLLAEIPQSADGRREAFSVLAAQASFAGLGREVKTLLVTSAGPGEGKSWVAAQLSRTLALRGEDVILLDCSLQKPAQHKIWLLENSQGISDLAEGMIPAASLLRQTVVPSVQLVTGGTASLPAEFFTSKNFKRMMEEIQLMPGIKIFDAPSLLPAADSLTLAGQMDAVLLVVSARTYSLAVIGEAVRRLNASGVPLLGVVLNKTERDINPFQGGKNVCLISL